MFIFVFTYFFNKIYYVSKYLIYSYLQNPSYQDYDEFDEPTSFNDLGLNGDLCLGLNELGFETPTEIQVCLILKTNLILCRQHFYMHMSPFC